MRVLSRDEEVALARRARVGDKSAEDELIVRNLPLVNVFARRFAGQGLDRDDLIQEGSIALIQAVRAFELERDVRLSTYAGLLIYQRMVKAIQARRRQIEGEVPWDLSAVPAKTGPDPTEQALTRIVDAAIDTLLDDDERSVLRLKLDGKTITRISRETGRTRKNVGRARKRAIAKLRTHLEAEAA